MRAKTLLRRPDGIEDRLAGLSLEHPVGGLVDLVRAQALLACVLEEVSLDQGLELRGCGKLPGMVVGDDIGYLPRLVLIDPGVAQELKGKRPAFCLLVVPPGVALLGAAHRAGDVVDYGRSLGAPCHGLLEALAAGDEPCKGVHPVQMRDVMEVACRKGDHLEVNLVDVDHRALLFSN